MYTLTQQEIPKIQLQKMMHREMMKYLPDDRDEVGFSHDPRLNGYRDHDYDSSMKLAPEGKVERDVIMNREECKKGTATTSSGIRGDTDLLGRMVAGEDDFLDNELNERYLSLKDILSNISLP